MQGLTPKQKEISDYLHEYISKKGFAPTFAEIQTHFGFQSVNAVTKHLKALKDKGDLEMFPKRRRSISMLRGASKPEEKAPLTKVDLPIIGQISAGLPIATFSTAETIALPLHMVPNPESTYVLKVNGHNLQDEMIIDGDLIIVEARHEASAGDTVVALINEQETIVSQYYPMGELIQLIGRNRNHHPMVLRYEDVEIQGVVVMLIRAYT